MKKLVDDLVSEGYLRSEFIQEAFLKINRRDFVPPELEKAADKNIALPIGWGVQIMQPQKAAFVLENLDLKKGHKILCLVSDSGWIPNLLAEIVGENGMVIVIDKISKLTEIAQENSRKYNHLKSGRIKFIFSEEMEGFSLEAPYDRIVSLVSFSEIPQNLKKQLKVNGKMMGLVKNHDIYVERKTREHFFEDEEIYLKNMKRRASKEIYSFNL